MCTITCDSDKTVKRKPQFGTNKRNRIISDSENDDEIRPVTKKNRFIDLDLSVEFETNTGQQKDGQMSEESVYDDVRKK